MNTLEDGFKT